MSRSTGEPVKVTITKVKSRIVHDALVATGEYADQIELPWSGIPVVPDVGDQGNSVAHFQPEFSGCITANNCRLPIGEECLTLIFRQFDFGNDLQVLLGRYCELRKEVAGST